MSLFGFLGNFFSLNSDSQTHTTTGTDVNPTNGLPMINDSIDVNGNPYGTDLNDFYSSFSSQDNFSNFDDNSSFASQDDFSSFDDHNDFGGGGFGGFD